MNTSELSPETGILRVDGVEVPFEWWGNRYDQPVLFFHDLGDQPGSFASVCSTLLHQGYCCLCLGLPFHHNQLQNPEDFSSTSFTTKLSDTLSHNGISKYILAAHSFGARFALPLAARKPELVKRLILICPDGFHPRSDIWYKPGEFPFFQNILTKYDLPVKRLLSLMKPESTDREISEMIHVYRRYLHLSSEVNLYSNGTMGLLYNIESPVDILWGKHDREIPFHVAAEVSQHFRNATVYPLEQSGHYPIRDAPDEINQTLLQILAR